MAQREERILDMLVAGPWWLCVALSATAFILLRYIAPAFIPAGPATNSYYALKGILGGIRSAAPLVALVLLMAAPVAAIRQWREGCLLDTQNDLTSIRALPWRQFETLVTEVYRRQGYAVQGNIGDGPDGGVDLTLEKNGNLVLVQCKQWNAFKVGVNVVRETYGVMTARHAHGAIVITSGLFTQEAKIFAAGKPIDLIEGRHLAGLIRSVPPIPSSLPDSRPAKPASVSAPAHSGQKSCPQCGQPMVRRTAQRGPQGRQRFWGCSQFPRCRTTLPFGE